MNFLWPIKLVSAAASNSKSWMCTQCLDFVLRAILFPTRMEVVNGTTVKTKSLSFIFEALSQVPRVKSSKCKIRLKKVGFCGTYCL